MVARSAHWRNLGRSRTSSRQARRGWEEAARDWNRFVETREDHHRWELHGPALIRTVGQVKGLRVLDLGCGQGWFSRELASRGARVTGLDWSAQQIAIAKEHERKRRGKIEYVCADAVRITQRWPSRSFDLVTSCMSFMDMPRLDKVLSGACRLLKPGGRLVFSVSHPMNTAPGAHWLRKRIGHHGPWLVDGYFEEGPYDVVWSLRGTSRVMRVPQWHRTFAGWFELFHNSRLGVTRVWEPRPTTLQARRIAGFEGARRVPYYLIFEAKPTTLGRAARVAVERSRSE